MENTSAYKVTTVYQQTITKADSRPIKGIRSTLIMVFLVLGERDCIATFCG